MHLVVVGLNHKTAPLDLRERLFIPDSLLAFLIAGLRENDSIRECAVLSTCNRTEVYAYTENGDEQYIAETIGRLCDMETDEFAEHLYTHTGDNAAEHLFGVAAGVDSMVLGEAQILGQVKAAYASAKEQGATGVVLNTLFQQAISVGKRARTETEIGCGSYSIGSVAAQLACAIFQDLDDRTILMIGAGKMGELTINHLASSGTVKVLIANRTYATARELAAKFLGEPIEFKNIPKALEEADVVITSTGASQPIITKAMVSEALKVRVGRTIFFIDIAVPRDVESAVGGLEGALLYDIDDLQGQVEVESLIRWSEVEKVESIIKEEVARFSGWLETLYTVPVIEALQERLEEIREREVTKLKSRMQHLTPEDLEAIEAMTRSIVGKICHHPVISIKKSAADGDASATLDALCEIFGLCTLDQAEKTEP